MGSVSCQRPFVALEHKALTLMLHESHYLDNLTGLVGNHLTDDAGNRMKRCIMLLLCEEAARALPEQLAQHLFHNMLTAV